MNSKQIIINGLLTHYLEAGKGPLVVMLHGWGDSSDTFKGLAGVLASQYQLIVPDLPGFGKTDPPSSVWGLDDYANFVEELLKKLGHSETYAIVGHSNGGALAIRGLARSKLGAKKLVLIAPSGIRDRQKGRRLAVKVIAKSGKYATFFLPANTRQNLRKKLYGTVGSDMFVAPHIQETFKKTVRQDVQLDAKKLNQPTLLIYGAEDTATPPIYGQIYKKLIKNSRLEIIPDATHFVHHDQKGEVEKLVKDFLA